ncbi:hypothetical protein E0Z10_g3812 [Xylaria hypoxylon]|uniref:Uncharacterized protein n=1 Tax=Xylaria hypoxylon TaxID=37992 RepID=A0A4Z0YKV1_9PEZI|nr:hypothetical protein E0Z10_g3812 [Xylaria hypoxylon]
MLFFNPLKFFVFLFVFIVALPLALCAGVTTIIAFLVLFLRLFLVYFDVGLETLQYILIGHVSQARYIASRGTPATTPDSSTNSTALPSPVATTFKQRRRVKQQGGGGSGSATPVPTSDGFAAVTPSIGLQRDFEGVGGWRLESADADTDGADERQWYNLNSRLENPYRRHHFRSQSGGALMQSPTGSGMIARLGSVTRPHSPEELKTPSRSSSRTPTMNKRQKLTKTDHDDYFPLYDGNNTRKLGI